MRTIEVTAKSVDAAIEKGLQMLGKKMEEVGINVIEKGSMLKKAKIEVVVFETDEERAEFENKKETTIDKVESEVVLEEEKETREMTEEEQAIFEYTKSFFEGLLNALNVEGKIYAVVANDDLYIKLSGAQLGVLIGHHGDTLEATQSLMNTLIRNKFDKYKKRVFLDIEGYREKRKATLQDLASRMAAKVIKNKRSLKLEPMNSYERRIIHYTLQNVEHIGTHSEGVDPNRCLIIDYID
ncbi:MAG: KH domain-containing protein [Clostridiales bacterium]|nr:KH domain-containing protein [Clostridiales bacterium]